MTSNEEKHLQMQESIQAVFVQLLQEKTFQQIRMSEVASRADTSRQNLYRYYSSKEELFRSMSDQYFDRFYEVAEPYIQDFDDNFSFSLNYIAASVAVSNPEVARAFVLCGADELVISQIKRYYARVLGSLFRQQGMESVDQETLDLLNTMLAAASFYGLKKWLQGGMKKSAKEFARLNAHFINGQVLELLR